MDFDNAYQTISDEWIDGEWWLVKKAHENGRLYEAEKTMHWCAKDSTALAKHELDYKIVSDKSIFVKLKVIGTENEYLIVWTTTPWTIPFNLGVMVHPDFYYLKTKVGDEVWIVAKALAKSVIKNVANKDYEVIKEIKGKELEGLKYEHPFEDEIDDFKVLEAKSKKVHTVVMSKEYVDVSSGTGLVHLAPGCGPEDYEVGHREGIPPFNTLDEKGVFPEDFGSFGGFVARKDDDKIIDLIDKKGALVATSQVEHDYPHCQRCKEGVIYRTTKQWFFKVEDLKENMREVNKEIKWVPGFAGSRTFDSWLDNLRDNGITRQRFWGTPLPIWRCGECGDYVVIGSIKELKELAGKLPDDFHKPEIDKIKIKCKCGAEKERIPDILDVWVDAGVASWNCLGYPGRKDLFDKMFPADFILEGVDQIRGWFNLLMVSSMVAMEKGSFDAVYMHGFINDAKGRKMSKSLGNQIIPEEVIEKYGADTLRFYAIGGASPGIDLNYNFEDLKLKYRNLLVFWNLHKYLIDLAESSGLEPKKVSGSLGLEEKYILSKMNNAIKQATEALDNYRLNQAPLIAEELFLELSRTYIQLIRDKAAVGTKAEKQLVLSVINEVFMNSLKLMAPVTPFLAEIVYQNLRETFKLKEESIHLLEWPKHDEKAIDEKLQKSVAIMGDVVQAALSAREKAQLGVRWPLAEMIVVTKDKDVSTAVKKLSTLIAGQLNVKKIDVKTTFKKTKDYAEAKISGGSLYLNIKLTSELEEEGFARELMRKVQSLRRKAGLKKTDQIDLVVVTGKRLEKYNDQIKEKVGAKELKITGIEPEESYRKQSDETIKGEKFKIFFKKV